jgi:hypothetical protein
MNTRIDHSGIGYSRVCRFHVGIFPRGKGEGDLLIQEQPIEAIRMKNRSGFLAPSQLIMTEELSGKILPIKKAQASRDQDFRINWTAKSPHCSMA